MPVSYTVCDKWGTPPQMFLAQASCSTLRERRGGGTDVAAARVAAVAASSAATVVHSQLFLFILNIHNFHVFYTLLPSRVTKSALHQRTEREGATAARYIYAVKCCCCYLR